MKIRHNTPKIKLSEMTSDPTLAAFFRRGEDRDDDCAAPAAPKPVKPTSAMEVA